MMKKYNGFTLLELIIVMVVMFILSTIGVIAYRSLVDSFSMNEVVLTISQDIRDTQRAAMMLERDSNERWLHGIGIDFGKLEMEKKYEIFKWCSKFPYYDKNLLSIANEVPNFEFGHETYNGSIPVLGDETADCSRTAGSPSDLRKIIDIKDFSGYGNIEFFLPDFAPIRFVLFESVTGKTFFYNNLGNLVNYDITNENLPFNSSEMLVLFKLGIKPIRGEFLPSRELIVTPVSGIVYLEFN